MSVYFIDGIEIYKVLQLGRVVVASSPLYQSMEDLKQLGYEVDVLVRVPDLGSDGMDRRFEQPSFSSSPLVNANNGLRYPMMKMKNGNHYIVDHHYHHQQQRAGGSSRRIKYREQGVDEVLQLKLFTVIATTDIVPKGATIILATGDGNIGQFNEDGYLGKL